MKARSELLKEEAERITRTAGYYVTPARLAEIMSAAQKVVSVLAGSRVPLSYSDCDIVLDLARGAMDRVRGEK